MRSVELSILYCWLKELLITIIIHCREFLIELNCFCEPDLAVAVVVDCIVTSHKNVTKDPQRTTW